MLNRVITGHPRLGWLIAGAMTLIVLGGTATAATGLISGKQIKNKSITGKKLKPGTLTARQIKRKSLTIGKFTPATVKALRGKQGAQGLQGPQGLKGDAGAPGVNGTNGKNGTNGTNGKDGVVKPFVSFDDSEQLTAKLTANVLTNFVSITSPNRAVMITAKLTAFVGNSVFACELKADGDTIDESQWVSNAGNLSSTLSWAAVAPAGTKVVTLDCNPGVNAALVADAKMISVPIG